MHEILSGLTESLSVVGGSTSSLDALEVVGVDGQSHVCVLEGQFILLQFQLALSSVTEYDGAQRMVGFGDVRQTPGIAVNSFNIV